MKNIERIEIIGKRWFDKVNGNTYFTAKVFINDELKLELPFQYGYEEHYIHSSFEELKKQNIIDIKDNAAPWRYCEENNIKLITRAIDVNRKKDL